MKEMTCYERASSFPNRVIFGLVVFFILYGVKFNGYIDSMVLALLGVLLVYPQQKLNDLSLDKGFLSVFFVLLMILFYSVSVLLLFQTTDDYSLLRLARSIVTMALLVVFVHYVKLSFISAIRIIVALIAIHAVIILFELAFPVFKEVVANIIGFEKNFFKYRSFGLVPAYDNAGAYLVFGMILCAYLIFVANKTSYLYMTTFFLVSGIFTGRMFVFIGVFVFLIIGIFYFIKVRRQYLSKTYLLLGGCFTVLLFMEYAIPLLESAIDVMNGANSQMYMSAENTGLYVGSLSILKSQIIFPSSIEGLLFGGGVIPGNTDIGFIKLIHSVGLMGLLLYGVFYFLACYYVYKNNRNAAIFLFIPFVLVIMIFNLKMLTFMSRGYHELMILMMLLVIDDKRSQLNASRFIATLK